MWVITHDFVDGRNVGNGSCDLPEKPQCGKSHRLCHRFRLLDCDGEVYYMGYSDDCESEDGFAPLDDFGEGYAGCTAIEYYVDGRWEML